MRILHLTDTHLGAKMLAHGTPPGWTRARDHVEAMQVALGPALREEVDLVLHTGDLFDRSHPEPEALRSAALLLSEAARRVPVLVMPGNHDRHGLKRSFPDGAEGLRIVDSPERVLFRDLAMAVVPYTRQVEAWAVDAREATGPGVDLMLAHQSFDGARVPGYTFRTRARTDTPGRQHLPPDLRWILCGHIHLRQVTRLGGAEVVQPGSTERTAFVEADQTKGYALWELERDVRWRFVDLPTRPMAKVERPEQLAGLRPGTLVKSDLPPEELVALGLWPARRKDEPFIPAPDPAEQLGLFA
ncbi:MAG: DNA repair exonuclease [Alphaproteobacteria bacterium]|nr:DNA repair exonuclease [Alphaproteobacteria bacterium]MCB9792725.1 DNA repair exonuclease [Alphaproteobacteria bacterium]